MDYIGTNMADLKTEITRYGAAEGSRGVNFASAWPAARMALSVLQGLVPATVRLVIAIVMSAGDTVAAARAPKVEPVLE